MDGKNETLNLKIFINNIIYNNAPIKFYCKELEYPHHNNLLNFSILEKSISKNIPEDLYLIDNLAISNISVDVDTVHLYLSDKIDVKDVYRIVGPLRIFNMYNNPAKINMKNFGTIVSSKNNNKKYSQLVSTWKSYGRGKFSDLDYEIRSYKHFLQLSKVFAPSWLERYFINAANFMVKNGNLPKHQVFIPEMNDVQSIDMELFSKMINNQPKMIQGSMIVKKDGFEWKGGNESYFFKFRKRHHDLLKKPGIAYGDVAKMVVRYSSIGAGGQFTMTPRSVIKFLVQEYDIRYEGFGAPFNVDLPFCSLMFDVDLPFGSMGPFDWQQLIRHSGNWSINPPFTEALLELAVSSIIDACSYIEQNQRNHENMQRQFHILFPGWEDLEWMDILTGKIYNKYLISTTTMDIGDFSFERTNGDKLYAPFGGLVYAVFSPSGKNNKFFNDNEMLKVRKAFADTVDPKLREKLKEKYPKISWKELQRLEGKK